MASQLMAAMNGLEVGEDGVSEFVDLYPNALLGFSAIVSAVIVSLLLTGNLLLPNDNFSNPIVTGGYWVWFPTIFLPMFALSLLPYIRTVERPLHTVGTEPNQS